MLPEDQGEERAMVNHRVPEVCTDRPRVTWLGGEK